MAQALGAVFPATMLAARLAGARYRQDTRAERIKVGDDVIGGIGVSGSPGVDEPCVQAGLDKVADQLK
jgi:hypothetical protein